MKKTIFLLATSLMLFACSKEKKGTVTPETEFILSDGSWTQIDTNNSENGAYGFYYTDRNMTVTNVGDSVSFNKFPYLFTGLKLKKKAGTESAGNLVVDKVGSIRTINNAKFVRISSTKFYYEFTESWGGPGPYFHHGVCVKN